MLSWLFSDPLAVGTPAPDFTLLDEAGHSVTLSKLRGKNVVLVFYPGDDTPGCNKQLCDFRDHWKEARERGTVVFGVNPQSAGSHTKFRGKFKFPFPLAGGPGAARGEPVSRQWPDYQADGVPHRREGRDPVRAERRAGRIRGARGVTRSASDGRLLEQAVPGVVERGPAVGRADLGFRQTERAVALGA